VDFYPTFLEVARAEAPGNQVQDGISLLPLLQGQGTIAERPLFWHFPVYLQRGNEETHDRLFRTRPGSVVRLGRWKLHEYFEDGRLELYDLENDIGEQNNLAGSMPEKRDELHRILKDWRESVNAPVPSERNPKYQPEQP
jgi:arylsulfatase A-like enzyme